MTDRDRVIAELVRMERKPTVPEVLPLVRELYARHSAGCCLHVVLDDNNVEDDFVDFAIQHATEEGHKKCLTLAKTLRRMSRTQRLKLGHMAHVVDRTAEMADLQRAILRGMS